MSTPEANPQFTGRILFADDDEQFRLGLGKRLLRAGFECHYATNSAEAMAQLETGEFDALLSDINMPGNVGLEMIENVPAVIQGLPIILLTGNPSMETATRSIRLRVTAYLTKPPDFEELCGLLQNAATQGRDARAIQASRARLQNWERDVEHIQKLLRQVTPEGRDATMQSYVRLTMRNLVVSLIELEHMLINDGERLGTDAALQKQELTNAIHKTISVLQKTRDHFKSKDIADLRKELESLMSQRKS